MKRCTNPGCGLVWEDTYFFCDSCYADLVSIEEEVPQPEPVHHNHIIEPLQAPQNQQANRNDNPAYVFEQNASGGVVINGAIAETNTQQYYQSKFTKFIHSVFSGEPYQLSHTSFTTIFRVEEHTTVGYPEQARDITLYGNMQNVFAVGDDVTVNAKRRGNRLIARHVFNHSINDNVRIQSYIPAGIIRIFAIIIAIVLVLIINAIITADYASIGRSIGGFFSSLIPAVLGIIIFFYCIRGLFGGSFRNKLFKGFFKKK